MKNKNYLNYRIQKRNEHLLNVLEQGFYIELGAVDMKVMNRLIHKETIDFTKLMNKPILNEGTGAITEDKKVDVLYQLDYLTNLRKKNSTFKFFLTCGVLKYFDNENCEKYAPIVLIPFDFDLDKLLITASGSPRVNQEILYYFARKRFVDNLDIDKFIQEFASRKINGVYDIDKISLDLAFTFNTTVDPTSYITVCSVEYSSFYLEDELMTPQRSIFELTEQSISKRYFKEIQAILPTNFDQKYVLLKIGEKENFAIDGRLGSGKTYTIINQFADSIAKGKKVLYVNQDLDSLSSLEEMMANLHLSSLIYNLSNNQSGYSNLNDDLEPQRSKDHLVLENSQEDLFNYIKQSMQRINGFSVQTIFEQLAILKHDNPNIMPITIETNLERHEVNMIYDELLSIEESMKVIDSYASNIWHRLHTAYNNITKKDIIDRIVELNNLNNDLYEALKSFCSEYGIAVPSSIDELQKLVGHIYNFVSIRPLSKWFIKENREDAKQQLYALQKLIDIAHQLNDYYNEFINKKYVHGRMKDILTDVFEKNINTRLSFNKTDEQTNIEFFNELIFSPLTLQQLVKSIDANFINIRESVSDIEQGLKLDPMDIETLEFLEKLSSFLNNSKLNRYFVNTYLESPSLFSKNSDEIIKSFKTFKTLEEKLPIYINHYDRFSYAMIEACYHKANIDKALSSLVNKQNVKHDKIETKDVVQYLKDYHSSYEKMQKGMCNIFGGEDYDASYIEQFVLLNEFMNDLTPRQKQLFDSLLTDYKSNSYSERFLQRMQFISSKYVENANETTRLIRELEKYNIFSSTDNILEKARFLDKWKKHLNEIRKYTEEIYKIFNDLPIVTYDHIVELLNNDESYFKLKAKLKEKEEDIKNAIGKYYHGLDTVINEILQAIEHYDDFLKMTLPTCNVDNIFEDVNFEKMLKRNEDLDLRYTEWIGAYRKFAVCFKGGQPSFSSNAFEHNFKLFRQFINKTDQIDPVLNINSLTEHFLEYNLKDLHDGIRTCKYTLGISKRFLFTVFSGFYKEIEQAYPELIATTKLGKLIDDFYRYECDYCLQNLEKIRKTKRVSFDVLTSDLKYNQFNERFNATSKYASIYLADLDVFNRDLNLTLFDLVIIDDAHLSSSNKYTRINECKQVVIFGDQQFDHSASNLLIRRLPSSCIFNYKRRYVEMDSYFNNVWNYNNQYIFQDENRTHIDKVANIDEFVDLIILSERKHENNTINVLVNKETSRREIYKNLVLKWKEFYDDEKILNLLSNRIKIVNPLSEANNYVDDVFVYFDDFKNLDEPTLILMFKNSISFRSSIGIYYLNDRQRSVNENIKKHILNIVGTSQMFEKQPIGITKVIVDELIERGVQVELGFGLIDFVIKSKKKFAIIILGKDSDAINSIVDDYLYYNYEYTKSGYNVKVIYTFDLYQQYDKCLKELLSLAKGE